MRKFSKGAIIATAGSGVLLTATALPAQAVDFVSESINGLMAKNVFIDSSATLSSSAEISAAFSGSSVGVVSLPQMSTSTFSASALANQILNGTNGQYKTIIVMIDSSHDSFGVASVGDASLISKTLNEANSGDGGAAILKSSETIVQASANAKTGTSTQAESSPSDGGAVMLYGGTSVLVAIVVAGAVFALGRNKNNPKQKALTSSFKERLAVLPDDLRKVANEFVEITRMHELSTNSSMLGPELQKIVTNFTELFARIERKGTEQQARMASVQYIDTFTKLNSALGKDYYLDIRLHPDLWDEAPRRLKEVETAVSATSSELINNIKQVNASKDLEFKVALESLSKSINEISVGDLYNDKISPTTKDQRDN
jgi:hypothetical protein